MIATALGLALARAREQEIVRATAQPRLACPAPALGMMIAGAVIAGICVPVFA